jgi:hypothetical protein
VKRSGTEWNERSEPNGMSEANERSEPNGMSGAKRSEAKRSEANNVFLSYI